MSQALPAPRLQLRWEPDNGQRRRFSDEDWLCHYELVLPLGEYDIRREIYDDDGEQIGERSELILAVKPPTIRGGPGRPPCTNPDGSLYADEPFRDGVHAQWDARVLGGWPVYVIAPDGTGLLAKRQVEPAE